MYIYPHYKRLYILYFIIYKFQILYRTDIYNYIHTFFFQYPPGRCHSIRLEAYLGSGSLLRRPFSPSARRTPDRPSWFPFPAFHASRVPAGRVRERRGTHTVRRGPGGQPRRRRRGCRRRAPRAPRAPAPRAAEAAPRHGPPPAPPPRSPPPLPPVSCRGDLARSRGPAGLLCSAAGCLGTPGVAGCRSDRRSSLPQTLSARLPQGSRAPRTAVKLRGCRHLPTNTA